MNKNIDVETLFHTEEGTDQTTAEIGQGKDRNLTEKWEDEGHSGKWSGQWMCNGF